MTLVFSSNFSDKEVRIKYSMNNVLCYVTNTCSKSQVDISRPKAYWTQVWEKNACSYL